MTDADVRPIEHQGASAIAVIFAGGVGSRMGYAKGPKQFMQSVGKPIIIYTLELFQQHEEMDAVYISTVSTHIEHMEKLVQQFDLDKVRKIVPGGTSAHGSIINGLQAAVDDGQPEDSVVLIHDGVRPIVSKSLISRNISETQTAGSSISSIPAFETVCESSDGIVVDTVFNRDNMYILQAPQSFRLGHIYKTNQKAVDDNLVGQFVDQANMMSRYGESINLTLGFRGNVKITIQEDLDWFNYLIETGKYNNLINR
jgi:2-C-methyl-D-erythritol 4-phosphate cytidylyltransferase